MTASLNTVAGLLTDAARRHPERTAVVDADSRRSSYGGLVANATRLGHALLGKGLEAGDRVAVWLEDDSDHVVAYAACALTGLVVVPVNIRFTSAEAGYIIEDSGARALVFGTGVRDRVDALPASDVLRVSRDPVPGEYGFEQLIEHAPTMTVRGPSPDEVYIIGYTSGTTGHPKGAMLTQGSVLNLARITALSYRLPVGSIAAMTGSLSFVAVFPAHVLSHFYVGGMVVFPGRWNVDSLAGVVAEHAATFTYVPSPLIGEFTEAIRSEPERWRSLTTILHSASKASPDALTGLAEVTGGRLLEGWGMTENSGGLMTATAPGDPAVLGSARAAFNTVGRAVAETEVRLAHDVAHDGSSVGELLVRSPCLAAGYLNRPETTANAFRGGWFATGDLGTIDPLGYVRIHERRTDLVVSGGMNVYPSEVERVIDGHPQVAACAVVGVPHPRWGQTVAVAVVPEPGSTPSEEEITRHCYRFLAGYKKPTLIRFVQELPRTHSHKLSRAQVRALFEA